MTRQTILRDSLEVVLAADDTFPARFYELLFERHPQVRPLFARSSPNVQRLKFAQSLAWIVDHYDQPDAFKHELGKLAAVHRRSGVTDEMYGFVGPILLETIREALGDAYTPEVEAAWREAYDAISSTMRAPAPA